MNHNKVKSIVFDVLESCDCEDERICNKCPFANLCDGIFTGELQRSSNPTPKVPSHGYVSGQMVRKMIEAYEGRMKND